MVGFLFVVVCFLCTFLAADVLPFVRGHDPHLHCGSQAFYGEQNASSVRIKGAPVTPNRSFLLSQQ